MGSKVELDHACLQCGNVLFYHHGRVVRFCSRVCSNSFPRETRKKRTFPAGYVSPLKGRRRFDIRGEKNVNWKGGVTKQNEAMRKSVEYKAWRDAVFARDNWTCIQCRRCRKPGDRVVLNADHIKPFAMHPELRFDVDNGRTLCTECHKATKTWGITWKKYEYYKRNNVPLA